MSEWRKVILSDIASFTTGKLNSNAAVENGKYPFFTCSPETLRIDNYAFEQEAILLAGNNAEGNFNIKYYNGKFNAYQRTYVFTAKDNCVLRFLFYSLKLCLDNFKRISQGTATKFLTAKILNSFELMLPNLKMQQQIASILSAIDDKIELNTAINENLEQQAQAYFVDLFITNVDPNWRIGTISDLGNVVGGGTPSKKIKEYYTSDGIAWITPKDLSNDKSKFVAHGETDITELGLAKSSATLMPKCAVLFSSRAPIGYIAIADGQVCTNQGFKSIVPFDNVGTAFVYYFLKENLSAIENVASGSTFKEVSGSTMKNFTAIIPDNDTLAEFQRFCSPLFEQQRALEYENRYLSSIRDTFLPKLMNGEIDVSAVQI